MEILITVGFPDGVRDTQFQNIHNAALITSEQLTDVAVVLEPTGNETRIT